MEKAIIGMVSHKKHRTVTFVIEKTTTCTCTCTV